MLCKINPSVNGTVTDQEAVAINFLRAIQAITTAAANTTPSALSQTGPTASPAGADIITQVISNTEGGGWANTANTNITSNYSTTFASPYTLDLSRDSGKSAFPFRKLSFRTNVNYVFNGSYTTYPHILVSHGFNTTANAGGNYLLGTTQAMPAAGGVYTSNRFDVNKTDESTTAYSYTPWAPGVQGGEWLVASTERYFILMSGGLSGTASYGPGAMMYVGLRTTQAWEDSYNDNPPIASVCYDASYFWDQSCGSNASMWTRTLSSSGTVNSSPYWYRINNQPSNATSGAVLDVIGNYIYPLSCHSYSTSGWNNYIRDPRYLWANEMQLPFCPSAGFGNFKSKVRGTYQVTGPTTDPSTGTFVPPAFPIVFAKNTQGATTAGGTAIGLYKSMSGSDTFLQQYYTPGQTFVINNEAYYAYVIGNDGLYRDMFLVRKA
jgi:hypothetical protein